MQKLCDLRFVSMCCVIVLGSRDWLFHMLCLFLHTLFWMFGVWSSKIQYISRQVLVVLYEGCVHSTQFWVVCFHQEKDPIQFKYPKQIPENACWSFQLLHIKNLCKRQIDARQDRINCLLTSTTLGNVNFCKIILNILSFSHSYSKFMLSQNPPNTKTVIKIDINGPKDKTVL